MPAATVGFSAAVPARLPPVPSDQVRREPKFESIARSLPIPDRLHTGHHPKPVQRTTGRLWGTNSRNLLPESPIPGSRPFLDIRDRAHARAPNGCPISVRAGALDARTCYARPPNSARSERAHRRPPVPESSSQALPRRHSGKNIFIKPLILLGQMEAIEYFQSTTSRPRCQQWTVRKAPDPGTSPDNQVRRKRRAGRD